MKKTAKAFSNIAFIKYWGRINENLRLPENNSISMNLSNMYTETSVEFNKDLRTDEILIDSLSDTGQNDRVIAHLNRIRKLAGKNYFAKVVSRNNFPASTGLSSSASGFAALTLAATEALGLSLNQKELSLLTRLASGSACRSIPAGFVEWIKGNSHYTSCAVSLFKPEYWNIADIVVILNNKKKVITTSAAQKYASTSPFFKTRLKNLPHKIKLFKKALKRKDFTLFGQIIESEALELHSIIMTQNPSLIYILPETISLFHRVRYWRKQGLEVYFSVNTGHNVHLLCRKIDQNKVLTKIKSQPEILSTIVNHPAQGARIINSHLF